MRDAAELGERALLPLEGRGAYRPEEGVRKACELAVNEGECSEGWKELQSSSLLGDSCEGVYDLAFDLGARESIASGGGRLGQLQGRGALA